MLTGAIETRWPASQTSRETGGRAGKPSPAPLVDYPARSTTWQIRLHHRYLRLRSRSRAKTAIIHLGMPKTGTSSLQDLFQINKVPLLGQGFVYHRFVEREVSQHGLACMALNDLERIPPAEHDRRRMRLETREAMAAYAGQVEQALTQMLTDIPGHTFIASSEDIMQMLRTEEEVAAFHRAMRRHFDHVRYVVYFRRQEDWILSLYSERLRAGESITLDQHVRERLEDPYGPRLAFWAGLGDGAELTLRLFERDLLKGADVLQDFCDLAGIDPAGLKLPPRVNTSFSLRASAFLRVFNRQVPFFGKDGHTPNPLRHRVLAGLERLSRDEPKNRLTAAQIKAIRAAAGEVNEAIRTRHFPDRGELFPERADGGEGVPELGPDAEVAASVGVQLLAQMLRTGNRPIPRRRANLMVLGE